ETLERAKEFDEPVVIHVITDKGHGYQPAVENHEDKLHGVGKFDIETGQPLSSSLSMTKVFEAAILEEATRRSEVVAITAAMQSPTGLSAMAKAFPDRVFDVGISEQHAVTLAAGLAMGGKRPVVSIYSSFLQRAFDQVICDVALHDLPVTFILDRAGVTGPDGPSHHGVFDLSYLRMVPNLVVGAPSDEVELARMLSSALDHDGPVAIRYPKATATAIPDLPVAPLTIGRWEQLSQGEDVLLLATGKMVSAAEKAAARLAEEGIGVTAVNARWVKPLDPRLPTWAAEHRRVVTVEDNVRAGGFGAGVVETLSAAGVDTPTTILGIPDEFLRFGTQAKILTELGLDEDGIVESVRKAL
ncbi:MAG: 1-deoxy-D-xylulose-5-phosphate synthase, partial [Acidimicrobiia bacterium]|nr:1-deoxy-D-xylulose-5-phosphate synthase [Acidimicrobiia bacterium]